MGVMTGETTGDVKSAAEFPRQRAVSSLKLSLGVPVRQNGPAVRRGPAAQGVEAMFKGMATAVALMLMTVGTVSAHHSFAVFFDTDAQLVKVTGVVRDFQFRNPHGVITIVVLPRDTMKSRGVPKRTRRPFCGERGWTPDSLHVGDTVTLEGWRAWQPLHPGLKSASLPDGRMVGQPPP